MNIKPYNGYFTARAYHKISTLSVVCCVFIFSACNTHKKISDEEIIKRKEHQQRLNTIRLGVDPYYARVPDSMKKWIPVFSNVLADDQKNRIIGLTPTKEEWKEQQQLDSQNLIIVTQFIDRYGWPAKYDAGFIVQKTAGLVIQHSPVHTQEKYFPSLVQTYHRDSSLFEFVALLEDRINMRNRKRQYYGTQVIQLNGKAILYPVVNIDSLEIYRNRLGRFMPLNQYLAMLKVDWNVEEYKKNISELEKKLKVSDTLGIHYSDF